MEQTLVKNYHIVVDDFESGEHAESTAAMLNAMWGDGTAYSYHTEHEWNGDEENGVTVKCATRDLALQYFEILEQRYRSVSLHSIDPAFYSDGE
jgi:hypothetical protein